ncbi:MAG: RagB/SusD family nutrient uptake outer membrane protein [Terrimonas sp.]|nr:RagB/SusD family nutrient uptake outer membrane protein [Terrimonas sp.]OJY81271.1 MAG: RagB/SusD family nutrient uptake outer membrane protein [Sphingobacteriales bacterium 40-81]
MKSFYKYIALVAAVSSVAFSSCKKDILDTVPNDRVSTAIFWKTETDAIYAVNAVYASLDAVNLFVLDGVTDIGHTNTTFTVEFNIENGTYDASHSRIQNEWQNGYRSVFLANEVLNNIDNITTSNTALIERLKAEARVLRAYFYIKLTGLYGDVPLVTTAINVSEGLSVERTAQAQVWSFINKELSESVNALPATYSAADKGRITKGAALALKARANLWSGNFAEAAAAAKQVMDLNVYGLTDEYEKLFTYASENSKEVILDKQFLAGTITHNAFAYMGPYSQRNSSSSFVPTKSLADLYTMKNGKDINEAGSGFDPEHPYTNRDPRMRYTMFVDGDVLPSGILFQPVPGQGGADEVGKTQYNTSTGYSLKKYIVADDLATPGASGLNFILLRYAEVLLTYAEAKIESDEIDASVYDAINAVRTRSDVGLPALSTGMTQDELRKAVRRERTVELAFEGWHLFDIRRWKTAQTVMAGKIYGITYYSNGQPVTVEVPSVSRVFDPAKHYLWPVPQKEKTLNPALGQNPGW